MGIFCNFFKRHAFPNIVECCSIFDRNIIEAAAGGALEDKTPTVARDLIFFMVEHSKSYESRPTELDNETSKE
uniref:Uncharacterized protein n=1 Tax=Cucumis melo TaxID=3656 RepID=A0A9I9DUM8_CUCME